MVEACPASTAGSSLGDKQCLCCRAADAWLRAALEASHLLDPRAPCCRRRCTSRRASPASRSSRQAPAGSASATGAAGAVSAVRSTGQSTATLMRLQQLICHCAHPPTRPPHRSSTSSPPTRAASPSTSPTPAATWRGGWHRCCAQSRSGGPPWAGVHQTGGAGGMRGRLRTLNMRRLTSGCASGMPSLHGRWPAASAAQGQALAD